ncbi:RNA polymerase sigma factor [Embleya hyalina]|uniref:RNA polymerase sigma factor n=1 Tax=Embleya hyalina TaxID=516124 RepID=UPI000F826AC7|nr:sigma factor-like helix-turn-helix DNA-binding protein [Embleya hyalina]
MGIDDEHTVPRASAPGFDALLAATAPDIARYTFLLTASPTRAAHVTRHTFARVWRDLPDAADTPADAAYVRTLAGDLALGRRFLVRRALWRLVPHPDLTARVVPHADDDTRRDQDIALLRALQRVPAHRRRVFVLRHLFGLSPEQVAAETEATTEVTRIRLMHAHEDLADRVPAITGPSPNCAEAHAFLSTLTRDLAARHAPHVPRAHTARVGSRARTATLVTVVVAAILALFVAALPRLLTPGTSRDPRAGDRVQPLIGPEVARRVPPVPAATMPDETPPAPAAAPPAPAERTEAPSEAPAAPEAPEPPPAAPADGQPALGGAPVPAAPGRLSPLIRPATPTGARTAAGSAADPRPRTEAAATGPGALLAPERAFVLDTSCVNNGLRRVAAP